MARPLLFRKSRTRSRQHLSQLKRSLCLCEDTVGVLFIHFSMSLSTLSLAAWISLVRWFWHLSLWAIDNSRSYGVTLQMKATEHFFFLWCCLLWCTKSPWFCLLSFSTKSYGVTIQMKATEQYFHNTVLIVFFCILQNEILNSFRILTCHFWEWMVSEWMVAIAFETARIYFLGWRVFAAVTVVISSLTNAIGAVLLTRIQDHKGVTTILFN